METTKTPGLLLAFLTGFGLLAACSGTEFGGTSSKSKSDKDDSNDSDSDKGDSDRDEGDNGNSGDTDGLNQGDGDSEGDISSSGDGCVKMPTSGPGTGSKESGGKFKTTYFHESVAVDPGKTGRDPSNDHGATPYPISPDDSLSETKFKVGIKALKAMIDDGTEEIEYFAFAHQLDKGLDKISLKVETDDETLNDVSTTNIYSAYGYISIRNLNLKDGVPYGDIDLFSFNYNPNGTTALDNKLKSNSSVQDATDIVGPASEATTAKIAKKAVKLNGFEVTISIGADLYDSVQYRAIRANLWSPTKSPASPKLCN